VIGRTVKFLCDCPIRTSVLLPRDQDRGMMSPVK
jgi:hypothetical protein